MVPVASCAMIAVMAVSKVNINRDIHVLNPRCYFVTDCIAGNIINVHLINSVPNFVSQVEPIDKTAHLIRQSGFKFVSDNVRDDVGQVGLIECDRAERSVLLLGEV